jgi:hypothetical protein
VPIIYWRRRPRPRYRVSYFYPDGSTYDRPVSEGELRALVARSSVTVTGLRPFRQPARRSVGHARTRRG